MTCTFLNHPLNSKTDCPGITSQKHQFYELNGLQKINLPNHDLHFLKPSIKLKNRLGRELPVFSLVLCRNIWRWLFLSTYYPQSKGFFTRNPTIFNIIRAGSLDWSSHWPSVWWSKYYFDRLKIKKWVAGLDLEHS